MSEITFELDIPPGLNSDDTTFAAKGRWADGSNVRFRNGRPETIGRIIRILGSGATTAAPNPRSVFAYWGSAGAVPIVVAGTSGALYSSQASVTGLADVSPTGLGSSITYWAFDSWGGLLMAAPKAGSLYSYDVSSPPAAIISAAPATMNHMIVTSQRQVMALGCNEEASGTFNPLCVRWSDIEDYANWTSAPNNNAGEYILEGQGKIVAGRRLGPYVAIWTDGMLFLGSFIGDPEQTYRFDRVADGCGLIGPGGVAEIGGVVYWMSPDHRFWQWSPGSLPSQVPCPISIDLQTNINAGASRLDQRSFACENPSFNEIWWFYPDTRDSATGGYRYVALNVVEGTWFRGQLDRRAAYHADFLYNPGSSSSVRAWRPFLAVDGDGKIYCQDVEGNAGAGDGEPGFSSFIRSADQYLNSGRLRTMISGVNPDFEVQQCPIDLTLYLRDRPQATAVTRGPYSLATTDARRDFLASGMIVSFKFSLTTAIGTNVQESWRLGKPTFDCVTTGGR